MYSWRQKNTIWITTYMQKTQKLNLVMYFWETWIRESHAGTHWTASPHLQSYPHSNKCSMRARKTLSRKKTHVLLRQNMLACKWCISTDSVNMMSLLKVYVKCSSFNRSNTDSICGFNVNLKLFNQKVTITINRLHKQVVWKLQYNHKSNTIHVDMRPMLKLH